MVAAAELEEPLSIFVHLSYAMFAEALWPSFIVVTNPGVEIAQ